ncbi:hypothetical protein, partial [Dyella sp.]|uniref:hypothetical protein n=1 Tax=Dyella sp. TaxID=1869338 RepID=UPI002ED0AAB8
RESGGNTVSWDAGRMMQVGDQAIGVPVLAKLYAQMKDKPVHVDLGGVFGELGVSMPGGRIVFDDHAPLAALRKQMTRRR